MHRQLTLILALSLLFTVLLPIHALAGGIESNVNIARMHSRMLKKRAGNPLSGILGSPNPQSGDGGAANVESGPTAQPQNGNPSTSDNTGDSSSTTSGQTSGSDGSTTGNGGSGAANGGNPSTGGTNTGSTSGTGNTSNTGNTGSTGNSGTNQSGNSQASSPSQQGNPVDSIVGGILGNPTPSAKTSASPSTSAGSPLNSTSASSSSTATSTSAISTSSTPTTTPSSSSPVLPNSSTNAVTTTISTSSASPSQTAPSNDDAPSSSTTITRNTIIILVAIGASVGAVAVIWTVIRKWKFRPSSSFEGRMQPIDWQPTTHDDGDNIADKLHRNASTRSHGSFTSGTGHSGANENSLVADLPPLDAVGGSGHLAPVGGYANLQRGPSPQPMYELSNPHHYPVSQQQYYNPNQGTAYGY